MPITPTTIKESTELIANTQEKLGSALDSFYEKIAFYSAGTLSLSVTFLGYVSSWPTNPVRYLQCTAYVCFPIYFILLFSWAMLLLSLVLGLYIRLFLSKNLLFQVWKEHIKLNIEETENASINPTIHVSETGKTTINNTELSAEEFVKQNENTKGLLRGLLAKHSFKESLFNFISKNHELIITSIFVLGLVSNLVFAFSIFYKR